MSSHRDVVVVVLVLVLLLLPLLLLPLLLLLLHRCLPALTTNTAPYT